MRLGRQLSVYDERRSLDAQLKRALSNEFVVVPSPDHPLLLRGPDLLVGGRGGITAILCPTAQERAKPNLALARFALARIALPSHARFVLIADDKDEPVAELLVRDVGAVISLHSGRERAELSAIAQNPSRLKQAIIPEKLRMQAHERFSVTYRVSRAARRPARRISPFVFTEFSTTSSRKVVGRPRDFARLSLVGSERSYRVDNGIPYATGEPSAPVVAEKLPIFPGDPDKYARANAFAGWAITAGEQPEENRLMEILDRKTRFQ
jgi:hypothetical protein